jgi:L-alanine-DL-glutamate epimerase-like enolase superfamily enzyme
MLAGTTITRVEPFVLHVPVTGDVIKDSTYAVTHWGIVGARVFTAEGIVGFGFTGTHAHLESDRLIAHCIHDSFAPLIIGEDACDVQHLWSKMYFYDPVRWIGRTGITHLALAAIDTALWDIKAKAASQPLWKLLGGLTTEQLEAYNTDGGWLSLDDSTVAETCKALVDQDGYRGVKIKIGSNNPRADLGRIEKVRRAIGTQATLAVDCNGSWDYPTMMSIAHRLPDLDVLWVEEPLFYDDLPGHTRLARSMDTPIALGEQLYTVDSFRDFIAAGAVHYVQPDMTRLGGITEWLRVADLAYAFRLPVVAHISDMAQVHVHLSYAHPAATRLEYIPWTKHCFAEPIRVESGVYVVPQEPGAGTTLLEESFAKYGKKV